MREHAKFSYSLLEKTFEKKNTIEKQREKKIKGLDEHGQQLVKSSTEKVF